MSAIALTLTLAGGIFLTACALLDSLLRLVDGIPTGDRP